MSDKYFPDDENIKAPGPSRAVLYAAIIFSVAWLIAAAIFAFCNHGTIRLPEKLNEWGDFAAGVFAPIAFVWLVVAVVLQSIELREQRKELALTRSEFKYNRDVMRAQAEEAKNQANYMLEQTNILKETKKNTEDERVFDAAVEHIATRLRQYVSSAWNIMLVEDQPNGGIRGTILDIRKSMYEGEDDRLIIASTVQVLRTRLRELKASHPEPHLRAEFAYDFQRVYKAVISSAAKIENLPLIFHEKAATLELDELKTHMTFIADHAGIKPFGSVSPKLA